MGQLGVSEMKRGCAFGMFTFISNQLYKSEKVTSERPSVVDESWHTIGRL